MLDLGIRVGAGDDVEAGLAARACSTIWPASKPLGMAMISRRAPGRLAASRRRLAALPTMTSMPASRSLATALSASSMTRKARAAVLQRLGDEAADAAVADEHGMVGEVADRQLVRIGRRRVEAGTLASGAAARASLAARRSGAASASRSPRRRSGLSKIERMAPARIRSRPCSGSRPRSTPSPARMNENSPICARLAEIVSASRPDSRRQAR